MSGASDAGPDDRASVIAGVVPALKSKRERAEVGDALISINAGLARSGDRPEPFQLGGSGRLSVGWNGGPDAASGGLAEVERAMRRTDEDKHVSAHLQHARDSLRR